MQEFNRDPESAPVHDGPTDSPHLPAAARGVVLLETLPPREERIARLTQRAAELFPVPADSRLGSAHADMLARIALSYKVPQFGSHHNEGMFMDSHLYVMLENIENAAQGRFPETVPSEMRAIVRDIALNHREDLERYVFLHDICKADCITLKYLDDVAKQQKIENKELALSWDELTARMELTPSGRAALAGDPDALKSWCEEQGLKSISYRQNLPGNEREHGAVGAALLRAGGVVTSETLLSCIERHEGGFSIVKLDPDRYHALFGEMPIAMRDFMLAGSYVDIMGSYRKDASPDVTNLVNLYRSRAKSEAIETLISGLFGDLGRERLGAALSDSDVNKQLGGIVDDLSRGVGLDPDKVKKEVLAVRSAARETNVPEALRLIEEIKVRCALPRYDEDKLRAALEKERQGGILQGKTLDIDQLVTLAVSGDGKRLRAALGPALGPNMKAFFALLESLKE